MIYEQTQSFYDSLCKKTKKKELNWLPLSEFHLPINMFSDLLSMHRNYQTEFNFNNSFFLQEDNGYLFLIVIDLIDKYTAKLSCKKYLLAKPEKNMLPINITSYLEDKELSVLSEYIDNYIDSLHDMPDTLYTFYNKILGPINDDY